MKYKILNLFALLITIGVLGGSGWYLNEKRLNVDTISPEILIEGETVECSIHADTEELTSGVTAKDDVDGDLSDQIIISGIRIKEETIGKEDKEFEITYVVFDSSNNMTSATRTLKYTDYYSPRFSMLQPLEYESPSGVKILEDLKAEDCIDDNISGQIELDIEGEVSSFGTYHCTATVTNSLGDRSELPVTFKVLDYNSDEETIRPSIELTDYIVYLKKGEQIHPTDYLKYLYVNRMSYKLLDSDQIEITEDTYESGFGYSDSAKGTFMLKDAITYTSDVDSDVPGIYTICYSYRHPTEGVLGSTELMVIVE